MKFVAALLNGTYLYKYDHNKVLCVNCNSIKCTPFRHKTLSIHNLHKTYLAYNIHKKKTNRG